MTGVGQPKELLAILCCGFQGDSWGADLGADHVAGDDHLYAAVELAALPGAIAGDGIGFAESLCRDAVRLQALRDQVPALGLLERTRSTRRPGADTVI